MKDGKRHFTTALIALGLLNFFPLSGNAQCGFYNDSCCDMGYPSCDPCCCDPCPTICCEEQCGCELHVGADFLWWNPEVDSLDFCGKTPSTLGEDLHFKRLKLNWEPGVRAWAIASKCNWELYGEYVYIKTHDNRHLHGDAYFPTFGNDEIVQTWADITTRYNLLYQTFDAVLRRPIVFSGCQRIIPFFGLTGLFLDQEFKNDYSDCYNTAFSNGFTKWNSHYWGLGLKAGADFSLPVACGLNVIANASFMLVAGESDNDYQDTIFLTDLVPADLQGENQSIRLKDDRCCHVLPGFRLALGISYTKEICCMETTARFGYEFVEWLHTPSERRFGTSDDLYYSNPTNERNIAFNGIFAGLDIRF